MMLLQIVYYFLFTISCLFHLIISGPVEDKYSCPHGWTRYGNKKCLKYVNELLDYERAQATCRQKNQGTLVTIHTHDEQNFVYSYIHSIAASSTPIWLGAKQMDFESILWLDKTENSYVNWAPSEPSHPDEICIAINPRTGMWHDVMCTEANVPACERAPTTQWPFFVAFCSEGWLQFNDEKCVRIISSQALNFYESQELCRSKYNSKLLSIKSDKESEFVHNLIKFRDIKLPVWLGAVQNDFSSFSWIDKTEVTFTNWAEGEPNDPDHACISMLASGGGKWSDNDCKEQKLILCQKVPEDGACETGWLQFRQDKCYRFVHVRLAFDDAESLCNNLYGGHLPSIHSQEEQFMISQFLTSVNVKNGSEIWLGAKQMDFHSFNWGDGSLFNYSYWEQGEPSFPAERCIEMSWRNGRWNDINCRLKRAVLCERQVASRHHLKPNLYQPTTCLNLDSNCTGIGNSMMSLQGPSSGPSIQLTGTLSVPPPVSSGDQILTAVVQEQTTARSSHEPSTTNTSIQLESLLTNKSRGDLATVLEQQPSPGLVLPPDDQPIKVISSIMNRKENHQPVKQTAEQLMTTTSEHNGTLAATISGENQVSNNTKLAASNNSTASAANFTQYNLPPPDRPSSQSSLSQMGSAMVTCTSGCEEESSLDAKTTAGNNVSSSSPPTRAADLAINQTASQNPDSLLRAKNSPTNQLEEQVSVNKTREDQKGDQHNGESVNSSANQNSTLMDKLRSSTNIDQPKALNPPQELAKSTAPKSDLHVNISMPETSTKASEIVDED